MKYAKFAIIVFVLYFLGYVLGPSITPILVDVNKAESPLVKMVTIRGGATYKIDLAEYRNDDLPKIIKIEKPIELKTNSGEGTKSLTRGMDVKLLNREGEELIIESTDGIAKGRVSIDTTNLFGALAQEKFDKEAGKVAGTNTPTPQAPTIKDKPPVKPQPVVVQKDPPTPAPGPTTGGPMATNPTGTGDEPAPDKPAPTPDLGDTKLTADEIVALMKKFIAAGTLKEFKAEQVESWKAGENESIDGVNYQIGLVAYKAQTIFGEKTVNAKALIKAGKIDRWVFAKSGMEMR